MNTVKLRMYQIAFLFIAYTMCACSGSVNGGVKTANDRSSEHADELPGDVQAAVDIERAKAAQKARAKSNETPEQSEVEEPKAQSKAPPTNPFAADGSDPFGVGMGARMFPVGRGLLISQAVQGAGASPPNCYGNCIGIINVTQYWIAIQVADTLVTDMVTPTGRPMARRGRVRMMNGEEVPENIAFLPPNPYGRRTSMNQGIASFEVACVSATKCPNKVAITLKAYQEALDRDMIPVGMCYSAVLVLPSLKPWGHHLPVNPSDLRPCP